MLGSFWQFYYMASIFLFLFFALVITMDFLQSFTGDAYFFTSSLYTVFLLMLFYYSWEGTSRSSSPGMFLKISQNSQENTNKVVKQLRHSK